MKRLQAHLAYALARAGWAGAVGVALLAFALAIHFGVAAPLQAELDTLDAEHEALVERVAQGVTVESPREQLTRFDAALVERKRLPSLLADLSKTATVGGLALSRVESRESQALGSGYARQEYVFPLRGSYPALRTWLADIQRLSSAVLVDDVLLRREDVARDLVEATVRVSILMKEAS
jgi:Tfp pilus assembly protein PilO